MRCRVDETLDNLTRQRRDLLSSRRVSALALPPTRPPPKADGSNGRLTRRAELGGPEVFQERKTESRRWIAKGGRISVLAFPDVAGRASEQDGRGHSFPFIQGSK